MTTFEMKAGLLASDMHDHVLPLMTGCNCEAACFHVIKGQFAMITSLKLSHQ